MYFILSVPNSFSRLSFVGDTVGLSDWQLIEANVTILCVSLVASKPVAIFLIPEGLVRVGSYISRSLRSHRSQREGNEGPPLKDRLRSLSHHKHDEDIELQHQARSTRSEDATQPPGTPVWDHGGARIVE